MIDKTSAVPTEPREKATEHKEKNKLKLLGDFVSSIPILLE